MDPVELQRRSLDSSEKLRGADGWYHSFSLPDGRVIDGYLPLSVLQERWGEFNLPDSLAGKRVLDIGTWDGWFAFEAGRRGADVTALDNWDNPRFRSLQKTLGLPVRYIVSDLYAVPDLKLEPFDIVLFLGVLYHLRHPLLGLEIVASLTCETAIIDSFILEGCGPVTGPAVQYMEFYEGDELANQLDNWYGPTLACLHGLCRAAGFVRIETLSLRNSHAIVVARRQWEPDSASNSTRANLNLFRVVRGSDWGINFESNEDQYLVCYFSSEYRVSSRNELYFSIGPFAAHALKLVREEDHYIAAVRLPPALGTGWWDVRLRLADGAWSNSQRVAVDIPVRTDSLAINGALDIELSSGAASVWVAGLAENADTANIRILLGEHRLMVNFLGLADTDGIRQVNAFLPDDLPPGTYTFIVQHGAAVARLDNVPVL